jgi:hypothetical protein
VVCHHASAVGQPRVVGGHGSCIAEGAEVFGREEAESCRLAEVADMDLVILHLNMGPVSLCAVLDEDQSALLGDPDQLAGLCGCLGNGLFDQDVGAGIEKIARDFKVG